MLSILAIGPVAALLPARPAEAQGSACDQLKASLAARIAPGIRGFTLEAVPAGEAVPPGAKVIGNCEGGARKILLRRSGGTQPPAETAVAVSPAISPTPAPAPAPRASAVRAEANRKADRAASSAASEPVARAAPIAASRSEPPSRETAAAGPRPLAAAGELGAAASAGGVTTVVEPAPAQALPAPDVSSLFDGASLAQRASGLLSRLWPWLAALTSVALAAVLWAWLKHRSTYDASGLPRGPKIN